MYLRRCLLTWISIKVLVISSNNCPIKCVLAIFYLPSLPKFILHDFATLSSCWSFCSDPLHQDLVPEWKQFNSNNGRRLICSSGWAHWGEAAPGPDTLVIFLQRSGWIAVESSVLPCHFLVWVWLSVSARAPSSARVCVCALPLCSPARFFKLCFITFWGVVA